MAFIDNLKRLREKSGLNRTELAQMLGVPYTTYANWEKGREPGIYALMKLADYFKISIDELIGYKEPTPEEKAERDFQRACAYLSKAGFKVTISKNDNFDEDDEECEYDDYRRIDDRRAKISLWASEEFRLKRKKLNADLIARVFSKKDFLDNVVSFVNDIIIKENNEVAIIDGIKRWCFAMFSASFG
ncbi:MAG: helix-turn-helix domain-containing protein [Acidaminococcales bacterium]|jgi:transcriptional regulator with XRE-family HTH domain|nr:helix-turn-helix domain-containing protein [Acidaminococcales bacterium]